MLAITEKGLFFKKNYFPRKRVNQAPRSIWTFNFDEKEDDITIY